MQGVTIIDDGQRVAERCIVPKVHIIPMRDMEKEAPIRLAFDTEIVDGQIAMKPERE
jgi:hypothetical protein